jgi:hypothetical protein
MLLIGLSELALPRTNALPAFTSDALSSKMLLHHVKATQRQFLFHFHARPRPWGCFSET